MTGSVSAAEARVLLDLAAGRSPGVDFAAVRAVLVCDDALGALAELRASLDPSRTAVLAVWWNGQGRPASYGALATAMFAARIEAAAPACALDATPSADVADLAPVLAERTAAVFGPWFTQALPVALIALARLERAGAAASVTDACATVVACGPELLVWNGSTRAAAPDGPVPDGDGALVALCDFARVLPSLPDADPNVRLVESERMATLGWLAAGIGHDLRAPLGAVRSNTELALRALERVVGDGDASARPAARLAILTELLEANLHAVSRATEILTAMKAFVAPVDALPRGSIATAVSHVLKLCATEIRHVTTRIEIADALPEIAIVPAELLQVIANLTLNAAYAMGAGGTIVIRARALGAARVQLDVIDDGPGLPPTVQARLFSPGVTTRAASGGTGLGLSIVRRLVLNAGGTIDVQTSAGAGTAFRLVFPAADLVDGASVSPVAAQ